MTMTKPRSVSMFPSLVVLWSTLLFGCGGGGGGGGGSGPTPDVDNTAEHSFATFTRPNIFGGSDVFQTTIAGSQAPVNLTAHTTESVIEVLDERVGGRIVYLANQNGATNFYSVPAPGKDASGRLQLTTFQNNTFINAFGLVGKFLVISVALGGSQELFVVDTANAGSLRNLTNHSSPNIALNWRSEFQANNRFVFYERVTFGGGPTVGEVFTIDLGVANPTPNKIGIAVDDVRVVRNDIVDGSDEPFVRNNEVVLLGSDSTGSSRQLHLANLANATSKPLTPPLPATTFSGLQAILVDEFLAFQLVNVQANNTNAFSVDLTRVPATPVLLPLTTFPADSANELGLVGRVPGRKQIVLQNVRPDTTSLGEFVCDLTTVTLGATASQTITNANLHSAAVVNFDDIQSPVVIGTTVVYRRNSSNALWFADVDVANSEARLLPTETRTTHLLDEVITTEGLRPLFEVANDPADSVRVAFVCITDELSGGTSIPNLHSLQFSGNTLVRVQMTNQTAIAEQGPSATLDLIGVKKNRVVYLRDNRAIFSADFGSANSELTLSNNTSSLGGVRVGRLNEGGNRVFFLLGQQMFSNPTDRPVDAGLTIQHTNLSGSRSVVDFGDAVLTKSRVLFEVEEAGGVRRLLSSPINGPALQTVDVSRTTDSRDQLETSF